MIFSNDTEIVKVVAQGIDPWIVEARADTDLLEMHYYGTNKDNYLKRFENLESQAELEIRKRISMSNTFLCDNLLKPLDNIWSAKGTSTVIESATDESRKMLERELKDVKGGLSVREYLKQVWKDKFVTDPNGIMFFEVKRDGSKTYITQKSIKSIRNMRIHGIIPEYIVFEPDTVVVDERTEPEKEKDKADKGYSLTWAVDDAYLYRVKIPHDKEKLPTVLRGNDELGNPNRIANVFQEVPAIVNSLIIDTRRRIKISPIQKQTELLNKYMTNGSVKDIFIAKHGYPIFWMYANIQKVCSTCSGTGAVRGEDDQPRGAACHSCGGSGRVLNKQVTDGIILKPPTDKEAPTIAPNVAGYVSPDIGAWQEMRKEQDWTEDALWFSMWGTTIEKSPNQTATGRILDENGMQNKLNDFADIAETVHKNIIDFFGKFYTTASYKSSSVNYSRKYILLTPDQHWERYLKAKQSKASERELNQLLSSYYESQYQTNDMMRDYYLKLMKVDPLPHYSLTELSQVQSSQQMKDRKIYFEDWVKTVEITKIIGLDLKKLQKDLDKFVAENKQVSDPAPDPNTGI